MENIDKELFELVGSGEQASETIARPSISFWKDVIHRLAKNKVALVCIVFITFIIIGAILVPMKSPYTISEQHLTHANEGIMYKAEDGHVHILGTDDLGRDTFTRLFRGARTSLYVAFMAVVINVLIGVAYGGISGYFGGMVDNVMMRIVEIINGIPYLMIVILIMSVIETGSMASLILAYAVVGWTGQARLVRGQVISLKEQEFVIAAKALGASVPRVILKHLIPNALSVIIVNITLSIPSVIFTEAFLSFVGVGISPPEASWGILANAGSKVFQQHPIQLLVPAVTISLTMLAFNLLGDAMRDATDPKLRR